MLRIVKSFLTIAVVAAIAVGATGAYFSSTVTSPGNTFATGTMIINVNGQNPTASAVFNATNLAPGEVIPEQTFVVNNTGSLNGHHLDLEVTLSGDTALAQYIVFTGNTNGLRFGATTAGNQSVRLDVPGWTAGDWEYGMRDGTNGNYLTGPNNADDVKPTSPAPPNGMDRDNDGKVTLADLTGNKIRIQPGPGAGAIFAGINSLTTATLWMNAKVDPATPDSMQGKTVTATFTWTLHQDASQM